MAAASHDVMSTDNACACDTRCSRSRGGRPSRSTRHSRHRDSDTAAQGDSRAWRASASRRLGSRRTRHIRSRANGEVAHANAKSGAARLRLSTKINTPTHLDVRAVLPVTRPELRRTCSVCMYTYKHIANAKLIHMKSPKCKLGTVGTPASLSTSCAYQSTSASKASALPSMLPCEPSQSSSS